LRGSNIFMIDSGSAINLIKQSAVIHGTPWEDEKILFKEYLRYQ